MSRAVSSSTVESAERKDEPAERFQQHQEVSERMEVKERRESLQGPVLSVSHREDSAEERSPAPPGPRAELSRNDLFPTRADTPASPEQSLRPAATLALQVKGWAELMFRI